MTDFEHSDLYNLYRSCRLCPRKCGADRLHGGRGVCGESAQLRLGRAALHRWEEPCLAGSRGAGAVFFSGCALRCVYCQNFALARGEEGFPVSADQLADIFLSLMEQDAASIDLVTPDHFLPHVIDAVQNARARGLTLPIVYNCSGYALPEVLKLLSGIVDIYLTDFKYTDVSLGSRFSKAPDYPVWADEALREMIRQIPSPVWEGDLLKRGVLVRHLILPGHVHASKDALRYLHETFGDSVILSIMNQYTPNGVPVPDAPELSRPLTVREYDRVIDYALSLGIRQAFIQEGPTASESFIPSFDGTGLPKEDPTVPQTVKV